MPLDCNSRLYNGNRTQQLLNKTVMKGIPNLYEQDGKGNNAIVYLKFFHSSFTWYLTELDPNTLQAFGFVTSNQCPDGELGYFDLNELASIKKPFAVERDKFFKKITLGEVKKTLP